jgi:adenylate cyclase
MATAEMASVPAALADATSWPRRPGPVLDWLIHDARWLPGGRELLSQLAIRLNEAGLPLARASFHFRTLHPQLFGIGVYWQRDGGDIRVFRAERGIERTDLFLKSPMRVLFEGAGAVRQRLDLPQLEFAFPLFEELREQGLTDYVALPVTFSDGRIQGTTWSSDRPGGFSSEDLVQIEDLLPVYGCLLEIHFKRYVAVTLLDTYVGHRAGERILEGQITRGSGATVSAAIWYCDLRGFTALSERLERDALLACLNDYFDAMAGAVEAQDGEILKFIGDAMLAIFPLEEEHACQRALRAALDARTAMAAVNKRRFERGDETLGFGIALHAGEVMYGNIGSTHRLDFTVIGPAVNLATRLEGLCRTLGRDLLISDSFAFYFIGWELPSLGHHQLAGIARPVEVFTVPEAA